MARVPEIHSYSIGDKGCIIPYLAWTRPLLDYLAAWKTTVFTCEKEVVDYLSGKTGVYLLPPPAPEALDAPAGEAEYGIGLFGDWRNPFDVASVDAFQNFLNEVQGESVYTGHEDAPAAELARCRAIFPIQHSPALSPLILRALALGIPVFLPESSRDFFPADLPLSYYGSVKAAIEKAPARGEKFSDGWRKAYSPEAIESQIASRMKSVDGGAGAAVSGADWARFLLNLANAQELRGDERCDATLKLAREAFDKCGDALDAAAINDLGVCLVGLKENEKAKDCFRRSGNRSALFNVAFVLYNERAFAEAVSALEKSFSSDEKTSGIVLGATFGPDSARLAKAFVDDEETGRIMKGIELHLMGLACWEIEKRGEALQALKEAAALDPRNPLLLYRLAMMYLQKRMVAQPIKAMNQVLNLFPFFFLAAQQLVDFYCQVELYDQALGLGQKYLQYPASMNPYRTRMLDQFIYVNYMKGNIDKSITLLEEQLNSGAAQEKDGPDFETQLSLLYLKRGVTAFNGGDLEEASRWAKESLIRDPGQALAINLMGSISYWKGEFEQASQHFLDASLLNPELAVAGGNLQESELAKALRASIIVVSHNDPGHAAYCLRLLSETRDVPYEIIYMRPTGAPKWDFLENIPNLRVVEGDFSGSAQAYNYGAAVARGKHFVFMEDDVFLEKNGLSTLLNELEREGVGSVGPVTGNCGNKEQKAGVRADGPYEVSTLDGFCMAVRRQLFKEIGGFDENFRVRGYEDLDLSLRIKLKGLKLYCHPGVIAHHGGLRPAAPSGADIREIDAWNKRVFVEKWESVKDRVAGHAG